MNWLLLVPTMPLPLFPPHTRFWVLCPAGSRLHHVRVPTSVMMILAETELTWDGSSEDSQRKEPLSEVSEGLHESRKEDGQPID